MRNALIKTALAFTTTNGRDLQSNKNCRHMHNQFAKLHPTPYTLTTLPFSITPPLFPHMDSLNPPSPPPYFLHYSVPQLTIHLFSPQQSFLCRFFFFPTPILPSPDHSQYAFPPPKIWPFPPLPPTSLIPHPFANNLSSTDDYISGTSNPSRNPLINPLPTPPHPTNYPLNQSCQNVQQALLPTGGGNNTGCNALLS